MRHHFEDTEGNDIAPRSLATDFATIWVPTDAFVSGSIQARWKDVVGFSAGDKLYLDGTNDTTDPDDYTVVDSADIDTEDNAGDLHVWQLDSLPFEYLRGRFVADTITAGNLYLFGSFVRRT